VDKNLFLQPASRNSLNPKVLPMNPVVVLHAELLKKLNQAEVAVAVFKAEIVNSMMQFALNAANPPKFHFNPVATSQFTAAIVFNPDVHIKFIKPLERVAFLIPSVSVSPCLCGQFFTFAYVMATQLQITAGLNPVVETIPTFSPAF
jgi:pentose-5-phosphate-3-epimerase